MPQSEFDKMDFLRRRNKELAFENERLNSQLNHAAQTSTLYKEVAQLLTSALETFVQAQQRTTWWSKFWNKFSKQPNQSK